jgi:predicted nucleic acid-binding protein
MFLDTSGLFCFHHTDEPRSEEARTLFEAAGAKLMHSYVVAELVALSLARGLPQSKTLAFVRALLGHPEVEVVWVGEGLNEEAMKLLDARSDKDYSLCDAVSFVLMRQRDLHEALTTDHHFEQEGFTRLLG